MSHRYALCGLNTMRTAEFWLLWFPVSPLCCKHKLACPTARWLAPACIPAILQKQNLCSWQGAIYWDVLLSQCPWWNQLASLRGLQGSSLCCLSSTDSVKKTTSFWNQSVQCKHSEMCSAHTTIQGVYSLLYEIISVVCNLQDLSSPKHPCGSVAKLLASFLTEGEQDLEGI